jgi:hypothetical protein
VFGAAAAYVIIMKKRAQRSAALLAQQQHAGAADMVRINTGDLVDTPAQQSGAQA